MNIWTFICITLLILGLFTPDVATKAAKKTVTPAKPSKVSKSKKAKVVEEED